MPARPLTRLPTRLPACPPERARTHALIASAPTASR